MSVRRSPNSRVRVFAPNLESEADVGLRIGDACE